MTHCGAAEGALLVQAHWGDLESFGALVRHPELGLVARAARARDDLQEVVPVTGEDPRDAPVQELARRAGVRSFAGDDGDVGRRTAACMEALGLERAARVLPHHSAADFPALLRGL